MTIDKRALREVAEKATPGNWRRTSSLFNGITVTPFSLCGEEVTLAHTVEKRDAEFIAAANPRTMLALLDENIQLQREKDAMEAVALALRDDMRQAREQLAAAEQERENWRISFDNERYRADKLAAAFNAEREKLVMANRSLITQHIRANSAESRIAELEAREVVLPPRAPENLASCLDGYGNWVIATTFRDTWNACLSEVVRMNAAGIGVKQQEDSVDSDVGSRNKPGMVVAVHIDAGDFVKIKGQVFEVEETDFDDHDVTLWFVGGNALKCSAGCPVEVVSAPVAADIKVKE